MKSIGICLGLLLVVLAPDLASADVNCNQVRRYAKTGRTPQDIAETMIIDVDVVKKCLESVEAAKPTPAVEKK